MQQQAQTSRANELSHATIIWGGSEAGRDRRADRLAAALVCIGDGERPCGVCVHCKKSLRGIHPDITVVDKPDDKREIIVTQIRAIRDDAVVTPNEADRKVTIIRHADLMNTSAQNALLKVLEEPPATAAFILVTENPAELLPTVRSRCASVQAARDDAAAPSGVSDAAQAFLSALSDGALELTRWSFDVEKLDKDAFGAFLRDAEAAVVHQLRDNAAGKPSPLPSSLLVGALDTLALARTYLQSNVSLGHIAGMMCSALILRNEENHDRSHQRSI